MAKFLLGLATILILPLLALPQAVADTPGCVSKREFNKVDTTGRDAWTRRHVARVYDTRGIVISAAGHRVSISYKTCSSLIGPTEVDFFHRRAWFKFWPTLRG